MSDIDPYNASLTEAPDAAGDAPGDNRPVFSVSDISQALKRTVEDNFSHVRVRGEISRLTMARSGHMYLTLKDENAVLDGVCWRGSVSRLQVSPEDGMEVVVTGRLSTYAGRSSYQIVIEQMEIAGEGALLKMLEDRRKKLLAEGLFDEDRKKEVPFIPEVIGVVTSPTGAVIRDIMHRLRDRFPRHVLLWPTNVQGEGAAGQIAAAIDGFNRMKPGGKVPKPDLIIVARGGGSLEDLWSFNEEVVVRAAAASVIPLISAVGHETDTTLIDFASDRRAPTPTAAAEMAVPVRSELMAQVADDGVRLMRAIQRSLEDGGRQVEGLARGIPDPARLAEEATQRLDDRAERLINAKNVYFNERRAEIARLAGGLVSPAQQIARKEDQLKSHSLAWRRALDGLLIRKTNDFDKSVLRLEGVSYQRVLDRGFALVTDGAGRPVSVATSSPGMAVDIRFHDGNVAARIEDESAPQARADATKPAAKKPAAKKPAAKKPSGPDDDAQGSLL